MVRCTHSTDSDADIHPLTSPAARTRNSVRIRARSTLVPSFPPAGSLIRRRERADPGDRSDRGILFSLSPRHGGRSYERADCPTGLPLPGFGPAIDVDRGCHRGWIDVPHPAVDSVRSSLLPRRNTATETGSARRRVNCRARLPARDDLQGDGEVSGASAREHATGSQDRWLLYLRRRRFRRLVEPEVQARKECSRRDAQPPG